MGVDAMREKYEEITVLGKPALYTYMRINKSTLPKGLYLYEVRMDDDFMGYPVALSTKRVQKHFGSIITAEPIQTDRNGQCPIKFERDWDDRPYGGKGDCLASIEYLHVDGTVWESFDYDDEAAFRHDVARELECGIPIALVIYTRQKKRSISLGWIADLGTLPKAIRYQDIPEKPCEKLQQFIARYRPDITMNKQRMKLQKVHDERCIC